MWHFTVDRPVEALVIFPVSSGFRLEETPVLPVMQHFLTINLPYQCYLRSYVTKFIVFISCLKRHISSVWSFYPSITQKEIDVIYFRHRQSAVTLTFDLQEVKLSLRSAVINTCETQMRVRWPAAVGLSHCKLASGFHTQFVLLQGCQVSQQPYYCFWCHLRPPT